MSSSPVGVASDPFVHRRPALEEIARDTLSQARALGASDAVVNIGESDKLSVTIRHAQFDVVKQSRTRGVTVTVFAGARRGHASSTDLSPGSVRAALAAAWHIARFTAEDPCAAPADADWLETTPPELDLFHRWKLSVDDAGELARVTEAAALAISPLNVKSDGTTVSVNHSQFVLATSRGFMGGYAGSMHAIGCRVIAGNKAGMQKDGWGLRQRVPLEASRLPVLGRYAAQRALSRLGARRLPTGAMPVLFDAPVALSLVGSLVGAISGRAVYRRQTFLPNALGTAVLADHLSVVETPHELRGVASAPFDREGVRTTRRVVVRDGVLEGYFLSSYSARKLGLVSTGHAGGAHNLTLASTHTKPGDDLDAMLKRLERGLFVTGVLGQGVNAVTGDYSRGVSGFWVDGGAIQFPVDEITIAGNLKDMLRGIVALGADVYQGAAYRCGSLLVERMQIAGR